MLAIISCNQKSPVQSFTTMLLREPSGPQSTDDGEQGNENSGSNDGIVMQNFRSIAPALLPDDISMDFI